MAQCGNSAIFLPLRFYVKLFFVSSEFQNTELYKVSKTSGSKIVKMISRKNRMVEYFLNFFTVHLVLVSIFKYSTKKDNYIIQTMISN